MEIQDFEMKKCLTHGCKNTRVLDSTWEICALGLLNYQTSTVCKTPPRGPQSVKSPPHPRGNSTDAKENVSVFTVLANCSFDPKRDDEMLFNRTEYQLF